jgi:Ca-activated chloride channel family protein
MKDSIENTLKNLKAPAPDPEARLRAKRAALAEFTRAHAGDAAANEGEVRASSGVLQALWRRLRLSRDNSHGGPAMKWFANRGLMAGAAGVGVLAIGLSWVLPNAGRYSEQMAKPGMAGTELPAEVTRAPVEAAPSAEPFAPAANGSQTTAPVRAAQDSAASPAATESSAAAVDERRKREAEQAEAPAPAPAPAAADKALEVAVAGQRAKLAAAIESKRASIAYVDQVISADIGQAPDASVTEALQRVQGITMSRQSSIADVDSYHDQGRDRFKNFESSPIQRVAEAPVSTFSADVDTASYSFVRGQLNEGVLPQKDAVRAEEMVNYFDYDWPAASSRRDPLKPTIVVGDSPWSEGKKLVHIGIKGYELDAGNAPDANLVLLIDVSGSMNEPNKLPLVVRSMELLLESLKPTDTVGIVVYAGAAGTVLEPTPVSEKKRILKALHSLRAGGSTAGAAGIERAYQLAEAGFRRGGVNRILLATDGDFNVGIDGTAELTGFVERKREKGVYLSVLGFGQGNYRDELAQALAQNGNGVAAYIDTESEARKVLVQEATGALYTIAKDVKLQVEFNPATVSEYRLVGYETRALKREDFNNDAVDAGDVGAGHTVTAIYEITPVGSEAQSVDAPRYAENQPPAPVVRGSRKEYGYLKIRYKLPDEKKSRLVSAPIPLRTGSLAASLARDVSFSTAVAGFAQLLRDNGHTGALSYEDILRQAQAAKGDDRHGYRSEFVELVRKAKRLQ